MYVLLKTVEKKAMTIGRWIEYLKSFVQMWKLNYKEENRMVDMYVVLIMNKRRQLDKIPAQWQALVAADLEAIGIDGNGNPIKQE